MNEPRFDSCDISIYPEGMVTLTLSVRGSFVGVYLGVSYRLPESHRPEGFTYDDEEHVACLTDEGMLCIRNNGPLDTSADDRSMRVTFTTRAWKPWLYFLRVSIGRFGNEASNPIDICLPSQGNGNLADVDSRDFSIAIPSPADHLEVTVSESRRFAQGTHARRMCLTRAGVLIHGDLFSDDYGITWRQTGVSSSGFHELSDGRVIGIGSAPAPIAERPGWYETELYESRDGGRSFVTAPCLFEVPRAKPALGHAPHKGPLYMASMVEREDGSLVVLMAGWFIGDDEICPYGNGRPFSRTYVCESHDGGRVWRYLETIGYDRIGSEGYNEGTLRRLPSGDLIVVMRTGSMVSKITQDNPIMMSRSTDGGATWDSPWRTGANGAYPNLLVLSDGMLALSSGRPGAFVMFSADEGKTWTDRTALDATPYSGYTSMVETGPGEILAVFGAKQYIDPANGARSDDLRLIQIRYHEKR